jgi:predicted O-linked N-acetylglucosamine transferase (SPINDLY family)
VNQQFPNTAFALQSALEHHQAGRLQQAENIYRQILAVEPENADACHLLGVIALQGGKADNAVQLINRAIRQNPFQASYFNNLGNALKEQKKLEEAVAAFSQALSIKPHYAEAHNNLGVVLKEQEKTDEALDCFERAISINPNYAEAHYNLGNRYQEQEKLAEAINCYQKTLAINPKHAEAFYNMGITLIKQKKTDEAATAFKQVLTIKPDHAGAYFSMGNILRVQEKPGQAITSYQKATALKPDYDEAYFNLGNTYKDLDNMKQAVASYQKALAIKPDNVDALNNLGLALNLSGHLDEALAAYHKVLSLEPDNAMAYCNLGLAYYTQVKMAEAVDYFRRSIAIKPDNAMAHSNLLFTLNYIAGIRQEEIYEESLRWDKQQAKELPEAGQTFENTRDKGRRLRVGYVSPDFRDHSAAYFIEPVLKAHNKNVVEVFCYANVKKPDDFSNRIRTAADHWISIAGRDDDDIANAIKKDQIDILVDLAGHSSNNNLLVFIRKPAPIQVTWLGYANTTGMQAMDYRLTDAIADPVGEVDRLHSEILVRLEHGFLCYQAEVSAPPVSEPPCLAKEHVTFGSFNNLPKINHAVVKSWSKILGAVPGSRLLLKSKPLSDEATRTRYIAMFADEGIAAERLEFYGMLPKKKDHLGLYSKVDIGLDPFPYNGTTTTCEALWMGVPVVTMPGDRHSGRVGASIMHHVGLTEFVADSVEQYIQLAQALAANRQRLAELRAGLRQQMQDSELMDRKLFTRTLEDTYRQIWVKWCEKGL